MRITLNDCLTELQTMAENSVDSIVTDPPYGIGFIGKAWDYDVPTVEIWQECLRVLKPGGHLLAFASSRTYHRMAVRIEDAGFEIRDQIMWIYGSGFPKSHDVGKTLYKKSNARPDKQKYDINELEKEGDNYRHKTNKKLYRKLPDINGDNLKVSMDGPKYGYIFEEIIDMQNEWLGWGTALKPAHEPIVMARKPIEEATVADNVLQYGTGAINIDASRISYNGEIPNVGGRGKHGRGDDYGFKPLEDSIKANTNGRWPANVILDEEAGKLLADKGGASRFFYCPKPSKKEKNKGTKTTNIHPTVKPIELMKYLVRLVTPKKGIVLDPFMGSGTTGIAAISEGCDFIGIEKEKEYYKIAKARIKSEELKHKFF